MQRGYVLGGRDQREWGTRLNREHRLGGYFLILVVAQSQVHAHQTCSDLHKQSLTPPVFGWGRSAGSGYGSVHFPDRLDIRVLAISRDIISAGWPLARCPATGNIFNPLVTLADSFLLIPANSTSTTLISMSRITLLRTSEPFARTATASSFIRLNRPKNGFVYSKNPQHAFFFVCRPTSRFVLQKKLMLD